MAYTDDTTYKKNLQDIKDNIAQLTQKIKEEGKDASEESKEHIMSSWHHIAHKYHDILADLKLRFNVMEDDVLEHTMKSFMHQAKEAGYDLQLETNK